MSKTGTLDEALEKVFDLYMGSKLKAISVKRYLLLLRDSQAEQIFSEEDVDVLLERLRAAKYEAENPVVSEEPEDFEKGEKENGKSQ